MKIISSHPKNTLLDLNKTEYANKFDLFISCTNEKEIIVKEINKLIPLNKKISFLDIGAGNGFITNQISKKTDKTLAIDLNKKFVQNIKQKYGIECIEGDWRKIKLNKKFDLILASHVLYYFEPKNWINIVEKMYKYLNPGGKLILIIFSDEGQYYIFFKEFFPRVKKINTIYMESAKFIEKLKKKFPELVHKRIYPELFTSSVRDMLSLCSFFFGTEKKYHNSLKRDLIDYFEYKTDDDGNIGITIQQDMIIISKPLSD